MNNKRCIVIVGPTAVGKTSLALQIARHFNTQIISADSRQCYRELNIGVAKPARQFLQEIHHYFINSHSVTEPVNAASFEKYACDAVKIIFAKNDVAVMVGGTGLYINAFCNGMDEMPAVDPAVKKYISTNFNSLGITWLQQEIQSKDPAYFKEGEIKNPRRLMRALEIRLSSGKSILDYQGSLRKTRDFEILKIGLQLPKEALQQNIHKRVDEMMRDGLLDEVRSLRAMQDLPALQTVGYVELFEHLHGKASLDEAINNIKIHTRQYAKRQVTWFKKDADIITIDAADSQSLLHKCLELVAGNNL